MVTQFGALENEACDGEGWVVNVEPMVEQQHRHEGPVEVGVEVSVQFEPLPDDAELDSYPEGGSGSAGGGPESTENNGPAEGEQPQPIRPGPGFVGATEVGSGMYETRIVPGEAHYFRIPVEWGQRPVATLAPTTSEPRRAIACGSRCSIRCASHWGPRRSPLVRHPR